MYGIRAQQRSFPMLVILICGILLNPVWTADPEERWDDTVTHCPSGFHKKPKFETEPHIWQKVNGREVIVYSAFHEERHHEGGEGVRIIAAGYQEQFNDVGEMQCTFWYEDKQDAISVPALYERIYPSLAHPDMYCSHFIKCKLPMNPDRFGEGKVIPYAVSVTEKPCAKPKNELMVLNRDYVPPEKKKDFAVCLQPLYNKFNEYNYLVEMFEMHQLLGADSITVYDFNVSPTSRNVLKQYVEDKSDKVDVQVIPWPFPMHVKSNVMCQRGALNDCFYRMRQHYKFIAVHDLDEVLVPRMVQTWPELMKKIEKPLVGIYMFQHSYFRRNQTLQKETNEKLVSQSSFWTTDVVTPPAKIRCKSMYHWQFGVSLDLHHHYFISHHSKEYLVDPKEGMLHHYRSYPMESFQKYPERYTFVEDRYMTWIGDKLRKAVNKRMKKLETYIQGYKHEEL